MKRLRDDEINVNTTAWMVKKVCSLIILFQERREEK